MAIKLGTNNKDPINGMSRDNIIFALNGNYLITACNGNGVVDAGAVPNSSVNVNTSQILAALCTALRLIVALCCDTMQIHGMATRSIGGVATNEP